MSLLKPYQKPFSEHFWRDRARAQQHNTNQKLYLFINIWLTSKAYNLSYSSIINPSEKPPNSSYLPNIVAGAVQQSPQPLPNFLTRWSFLPLLHNLQCEMQQLPLALLPPLDHLQDGDSSAQVPAQLQHLLIWHFVVLSVLKVERWSFRHEATSVRHS